LQIIDNNPILSLLFQGKLSVQKKYLPFFKWIEVRSRKIILKEVISSNKKVSGRFPLTFIFDET
jgi:hypothetical protein